jgi:long-subunit fatty acid transport protein
MKTALGRGLILLLCPTLGATVGAQEDLGSIGPTPLEYSFAPPGARSLAMGASFLGLADDATAAASNPAGLTILTRPEVSAHFRYSSFDLEAPNTVTGIGTGTFTDQVGSPSFFSFVYPWKSVSVSAYYQRSSDFRSHSFFEGLSLSTGDELLRYDEVNTKYRLEIFGAAVAFKLGSKVAIGGSLQASQVSLESLGRFTFPVSVVNYLFQGTLAPDVSGAELTWNAGVLFTPVPKVSLGAVYKKGAKTEFTQDFQITLSNGLETIESGAPVPTVVPINVPDVFGGGLALRPTESFTVLVDVVRIKYSQASLSPEQSNIYQTFGFGGDNGAYEALTDKTEFHLGAEYTWAGGSDWIFALRAGYYSDPDHDGIKGIDSGQHHATLGGGVVIKNRLQVDVAGNFAKNIRDALISLVVRF